MINFEVKSRWTGEVKFTAEINCAENTTRSIKLGLAVKWGLNNNAYLRGADLGGAYLRGAYLMGADLRDAYLRGADLMGADLMDADLGGADLRDAYLRGADLMGADLMDADLMGVKWGDAPVIKGIHEKVLASAEKEGAFGMDRWGIIDGVCGTTMCRAGHVVRAAGKAGLDLSVEIGVPGAALAIYAASDPEYMPRDGVPNFCCGNAEALADMRRLAEMEVE